MGKRGALREAVAGAGVILGLVFVGYETKQNTEALRSQTMQTTAEMSRQHTALGVESQEFRVAWDIAITRDDPEALTQDQRQILSWWFSGAMRVTEHRYRQFELGTLSEAFSLGGGAGFYQSRYFQEWWSTRSHAYAPDFATWVREELLSRGAP